MRVAPTRSRASAGTSSPTWSPYRDDITFRHPTAVEESKRDLRERDLTEAILAEIRERGLVFALNSDRWSVTLVDPSLASDLAAEEVEYREAVAASKRFERENSEAMTAEAAAAAKADFAAALKAGDTESVAGMDRRHAAEDSGAPIDFLAHGPGGVAVAISRRAL